MACALCGEQGDKGICDACFAIREPSIEARASARGLCIRCLDPRGEEPPPYCALCWQQVRDDTWFEQQAIEELSQAEAAKRRVAKRGGP